MITSSWCLTVKHSADRREPSMPLCAGVLFKSLDRLFDCNMRYHQHTPPRATRSPPPPPRTSLLPIPKLPLRDAAENDVATELLADFLEGNGKFFTSSVTKGAQADESANSFGGDEAAAPSWRLLSRRFPLDMWGGAIAFFKASP